MIFNRPTAYRLTTKIYGNLQEPIYMGLPTQDNPFGTVCGILNLSHSDITTKAHAKCCFKISPKWVTIPPEVICNETWIKRGVNWHVSSQFSLCYILGDEWRDGIKNFASRLSMEKVENIATFWCLKNTKALLYKHRQASDLGINEWPSKWDYWGHYDLGQKEYNKCRRNRR
jgi:hypothetical protein